MLMETDQCHGGVALMFFCTASFLKASVLFKPYRSNMPKIMRFNVLIKKHNLLFNCLLIHYEYILYYNNL